MLLVRSSSYFGRLEKSLSRRDFLFLLVLYPELLANEMVLPYKGIKTLFCDSLTSCNPEPTVSIGI